MNTNEVSTAEVAERAAAIKKRPTRDDLKGKPGYWERPAQVLRAGEGWVDGYEWGVSIKPNDGHGKLTREGAESVEMLKPAIEADTARNHKLQARVPRATLADSDGRTQYVRAEAADDVAKANGWHHRWRAKGRTVAVARGGLLWRLVGDAWIPEGPGKDFMVTCPDGMPWRFVAGEWREA